MTTGRTLQLFIYCSFHFTVRPFTAGPWWMPGHVLPCHCYRGQLYWQVRPAFASFKADFISNRLRDIANRCDCCPGIVINDFRVIVVHWSVIFPDICTRFWSDLSYNSSTTLFDLTGLKYHSIDSSQINLKWHLQRNKILKWMEDKCIVGSCKVSTRLWFRSFFYCWASYKFETKLIFENHRASLQSCRSSSLRIGYETFIIKEKF